MKSGESMPAEFWAGVVQSCDESGFFHVFATGDDAPEDAKPAKIRRCDFNRTPKVGERCSIYRVVDDNGGRYYARVFASRRRRTSIR